MEAKLNQTEEAKLREGELATAKVQGHLHIADDVGFQTTQRKIAHSG